jgi:hypothetical protein
LPFAVRRNLFFAPLLVFILGILTSFFLKGSLFRLQSKDFSGKAKTGRACPDFSGPDAILSAK